MIATADAMIKAANPCTAFFPRGTGGSNLQRTIGLKAPLPRALGEPAAPASLHTTWTSLYHTALLGTLLERSVSASLNVGTKIFAALLVQHCGDF
jgi:hypothetical protein